MKIQYIIYVLIAFLSLSCSNEESDKQQTLYGKVDVTVSVTLPQPESVNAFTRSYTDTDIKNVDVLVFNKDGKFMERVKVEGNQLTATATGVTFTVRLNATSEKRIIHLVTNGRTADGATDRLNFNDLNVNMAEAAAISSLHTASLENVNNGESTLVNNVMPLVMWGRFVLDNGINIITTANNVKLLRSAACIQVKKAAGSSSNGLNDFVIEGITVHKGKSYGFLAPANCTGAVSTPATANPVTDSNYLDYNKGWVHAAEPSLYIYERNCTVSDYMAVILKGKYKEKLGYYKIVMTDGNGTPLNVVRNHRYIITIVGVNAPGYADVATAVASAPSNTLKVELKDEDIDFSCIVADGQHQMASSNNVFELYGKTGGTTSATGVEICTVYSDRGLSPVLSAPGATWLTNLSAQALGGNKYRITGDFTSSGNSPVTTTLTMTCDNLSLPVEINWNPIISNQKDNDSYVFDLIKSTDKNWNIRVVNPSSATGLFLHPSSAVPAGYSGDGMLSELSSKYSAHAYLHVVIGSNKRGSVQKASVSGGKAIASKIMIVQ
ncbi:FimB/Mfa2 family fimbrial subunit [Bacteroides helcogenes]|uniref:Major fimbrial subunit protein N-terminal domain-containing protein n=1 Tax=Bacteroides helcogenes (strain ATCC 35417 / DSM 20613 / JCM 6297 / CCUG 15421 / P 36-108) TaxID=693979 RepID=E6SSH1_BACT6|nr:FimB/Mfa2 family fimbrial subunit [Bacteroides helcogenes]ADV42143.1 hypothetical protein Bache_0113 [Bacteroides helcogenes P 36-108]